MQFPYSAVRPQQENMMNDVRSTVDRKRHLIADAPTGLGKTIAAIFPALEHAVQNDKTVFFLTSRLSQHRMAIETVQKISQTDKIGAVDIVGKKWLCSHDVEDMDSSMFSNFCSAMVRGDECKYYNNFQQKGVVMPEAGNMISIIGQKPLHAEDAKKMAGDKFCTFELLAEAAKNSRVIVGDYFHIFSSNWKKFSRRINKNLENSIIIVDEAHNLPQRIRDHMSAKISTRTIDLAKKENQNFSLGAGVYIECLEESVSAIAKHKLIDKNESFMEKNDLIGRIDKLCGYRDAIIALTSAGESVLEERKRSFIDRLATFLDAWKGDDFGYARLISREVLAGKDHISVFYNCMDPSIISKPIIEQSHSTILMSGTLSPMEMYRDLLDMGKERTDMKSYVSPFPRENRLDIIATGITTKYTERSPENYGRIASAVALCAASIKGNVAVFFPSYEIMKIIYAISKESITKPVFMEIQGMTKAERRKLQEEFAACSEKGAILFGVLAGSFSEGIDLPGDRLNGVIVVGLPLEKPTLAIKALIDYYDSRFKRGREYGYVYPAMIKVMQAAGRCIRTEKDIGVCIFADERFLWKNYRYIFPKDWTFVITERPELEARRFFGNQKL